MGGTRGRVFRKNIKDKWRKPRGSGIWGGRWGWLGWKRGGKCRHLYLNNNNKII